MALNFAKAEFVRSAGRREDFIRDGLPQFAFAGRSNVGKSPPSSTGWWDGRTLPMWAPPPARPPR